MLFTSLINKMKSAWKYFFFFSPEIQILNHDVSESPTQMRIPLTDNITSYYCYMPVLTTWNLFYSGWGPHRQVVIMFVFVATDQGLRIWVANCLPASIINIIHDCERYPDFHLPFAKKTDLMFVFYINLHKDLCFML